MRQPLERHRPPPPRALPNRKRSAKPNRTFVKGPLPGAFVVSGGLR